MTTRFVLLIHTGIRFLYETLKMKTVSASVLIVVAYFLVVAETQTTLKPATGCNCCSSCGLTTAKPVTTTTPKPTTTTPKPTTTIRTTTTPKPTTTTSKRTTTTPKPTTTTPKPTTTTRKPTTTTPKPTTTTPKPTTTTRKPTTTTPKPTTTTPQPTTTTSIPALTTDYCNIATCNTPQSVLTDNTLCKYSNTTWGDACQPSYPALSVVSAADITTILTAHNDYRRKVAQGLETQGNPAGPQPPASNMRELQWDQELSVMAAAWAQQCVFEHDKCRDVPRFKVGQNIAVSMSSADDIGTSNWSNPVADWYSEVQYMTSDYVSNFPASTPNVIGHYTQVVWAETYLVGCATAYYQSTALDSTFPYNRFFVCNYAPAGNFISKPVYLQGTAGSACPTGTTDNNGLCA